MTTEANSLVESAKQYAREAILEAWPSAKELATPTDGMYEFEAICIDEQDSEVSSASIMHDPNADAFVLIEIARETAASQSSPEVEKPAPQPAWPIDWDRLKLNHEIAFLRGDLATNSPESYTIDEMREISEGMDANTAEVEAALKADFAAIPPFAQGKMLNLLKQADPSNYEWWWNLLVGPMSNSTTGFQSASNH